MSSDNGATSEVEQALAEMAQPLRDLEAKLTAEIEALEGYRQQRYTERRKVRKTLASIGAAVSAPQAKKKPRGRRASGETCERLRAALTAREPQGLTVMEAAAELSMSEAGARNALEQLRAEGGARKAGVREAVRGTRPTYYRAI